MSTILVVEDEDILREIIIDYLVEDGYKVLEAADGEKALELFQTNSVDLVILDIGLPKIEGWSVCRRIRKNSSIPMLNSSFHYQYSNKFSVIFMKINNYIKHNTFT